MPVGAEMLVRLRERLSDEQLAALRRDLYEFFGHDDFRNPDNDSTARDLLPLALIDDIASVCDHLDRDSIWLDLNLAHAYYGPGYERGDFWFFVACAIWLEHRVPGCEVWYGHDCDDRSVLLFDAKKRAELIAYWCQHGNRPYRQRTAQRPNSSGISTT